MSSLPANATASEIEEEILYQQTLLVSLDGDADDHAEREQEIQTELGLLEERLALANSLSNDISDSSISLDSTSTPLTSEPYSRPGSTNSSKRPLPNDFYSDHTTAPKRTSPSTDNTARLVQERARLRQRQAEAAWEAQRVQRIQDEAYARRLSQQADIGNATVAGPSSRPSHTFQSTLGNDSRVVPPVRSLPSNMQPTPLTQIKQDPEPTPAPRAFGNAHSGSSVSGDIIDLTADDALIHRYQPLTTQSSNTYGSLSGMPGSYPGSSNMIPPPLQNYYPGMTMASPIYHPGMNITPSSMPGPSANPGASSWHMPWQRPAQQSFSLANPIEQLQRLVNASGWAGNRHMPINVDDDEDDDDENMDYRGPVRAYNPYAGREDLYRQRYEQIESYNPEKTQAEINALLGNIRPDEDLPDDLLVQTPEAMNIKLHKYQELGLTWLKNCEEGSNKGGILADDMGLGKTIQMLSLIVSRKSTDPRCKTTLIVAPVALLRQWQQEIEQKIKRRFGLSVHVHHSTNKKSHFRELQVYDIVLTTFGSLAIESRKMEKFHLRKKHDSQAIPRADERCTLIDPDCKWYRVILDEAQCIKNKNTQTARAAFMLNATYRFCMTGTPMMNNVGELYSLVKFLQIKPYDRWEKFRLDIAQPLKRSRQEERNAAMKRLQALCKAVMIRRTKKSQYRGKPILILPERTTDVDHAEFDEDEQSLYTSLETQTQVKFSKYLAANAVGRSYTQILVLLLRLRQACCHPLLINDLSIAAAADMTPDALLELARELPESAVNRIKESNGNFECPICMDAVINPAIFLPCGHDTCRECYIKLADTSTGIAQGHENGVKARCPHCRGDIDPKRITDFLSFKREWMPELLTRDEKEQFGMLALEEAAEDVVEKNADEDTTTESETEAGDDDDDDDSSTESEDEGSDLDGFIVKDDQSESEVRSKKAGKCKVEADALPKRKKKKSKGKKKGKAAVVVEKEPKRLTLAMLNARARGSTKRKAILFEKLQESYKDSAKIRKMLALLDDITANDPSEKVLIFSQWTSLLDLCEIAMQPKGWNYRRYDGSMNATERADAVDDFKDPRKDVRIMLVSLKAGNAGLNLDVASQVIILDPFWNPYIEEQAIDRAHRIGQERPVKVHRVLVQNTVEDRIIELQENKRKIIKTALDEKEASQLSRLGPRELAYLFGVTRNLHDPV